MRHLGSLLLSLILAPIIWVLTGFGLGEYLHQPRTSPTAPDIELLLGAAALLLAGVLYALLVLPRLSPLGPVLVGLAYLGLVTWNTLDAESLLRGQPQEIVGITNPLPYPAEGVAALLAVPLLATLFSPRRWRRYERMPALYDGRQPDHQTQPMPYAEHQTWHPSNAVGAYPPESLGGYPPASPGGYPPGGSGGFTPASPGGYAPASSGGYPPADWPAPPSATPRTVAEETTIDQAAVDQTTIDQAAVDQATEDLAGETRPLGGTPPPPAAYPPPGHSTRTAPPVDAKAPPVGPGAPADDPDATRRL